MGVYVFDKEDAIRFAREKGIRAYIRGEELILRECPYCHGGKSKDTDTFAINLTNGAFNCMRSSCGEKGNMIRLHDDFGFSLGRDADTYYARKRERRRFRTYTPEIRDGAIAYMATRGISEEVTRQYSITTKKDEDSIVVFPFYDTDKTLHFVKYRNTKHQNGDNGSKEWSMPGMEPILFGMDHCDPKESETLVITEGQIDSLSVTEAGIPNAVSVPTGAKGTTWYPNCADFLRQFREVVVFGDHENGEITLLRDIQARFHGRVKHVREEDYKDCKDANEILLKYGPEAVRDAVNNAVTTFSKRTIAMCDVRPEDDTDTEKLRSGINGLDRLTGGFRFGSLVILTGERGLGKSTLGSQFIAQAVNEGIISYIYSGEMRNCDVQNWIDRQFAGSQFIEKREAKSGYEFFVIDREIEERIWKWYGKYLFMYNNSYEASEDDAEEQVVVVEELKDAIVNLGARVLLVDNLMIAMESGQPGADLYREQTRLVNQLAKLAKTYNALIFLVAHPRKGTSSENSSNDDISGSGHITDLADIVLKYTKPPKKDITDERMRLLQVLKNRNNGMVDYKGIELWFEKSSKRIAEKISNTEDFGWRYSWEIPEDQWLKLPDEELSEFEEGFGMVGTLPNDIPF